MPLFMDIHTVQSDSFTIEDVVKAHFKDLAVQEKFGVIQHKYWVNVESNMIFCLIEGPSKKACNEVHLKAHGESACNIVEVSDDEFNYFINVGTKNKNDLAHTLYGKIDKGYRTIQLICVHDFTGTFTNYIQKLYRLIKNYEGTIVPDLNDDIMVVFVSASNAILCTIAINDFLMSISDHIEFKLALVTGNPVDEIGANLFESTKKKIRHLNNIGSCGLICMDDTTKLASDKEPNSPKINQADFRMIHEADFLFLDKMFHILNDELYKSDFKSKALYSLLAMSKSRAYRKMKALTGMASNKLIQELRLHQSLKFLKKKSKTISEIAYDLGFSSPTYFTRVFRKRFGILPTSFAKISEI